MSKKEDEFGWLIYYYPICALFLVGLASILFGYWNPMDYAKYINSLSVIGGFILLLIILFRKEKVDKEYNLIVQVITFTLVTIIEVTLIQKLGNLTKEINPLIVCLSFIIPLSLLFYQRFKINILRTGNIININGGKGGGNDY